MYTPSTLRTTIRHHELGTVDRYVIISKLLDPIFIIFPLFVPRYDIHTYASIPVRNVAYTRNDVDLFVRRMDYSSGLALRSVRVLTLGTK
jgi:hypothetical protein